MEKFAFEKQSLGPCLDRILQNLKAVVRKLCSLAMSSGVSFEPWKEPGFLWLHSLGGHAADARVGLWGFGTEWFLVI